MNERIKELAEQCWDQRLDGRHFDQEMFAELIVKECANIANNAEPYKANDLILKHFGVEESKGWVCSKCGIDRTKEVCPLGPSAALEGRCPMVISAQ